MLESWPEEPTVWFGFEFEPLVTIHLPREPVSQGADGRKRRGLIADLQDPDSPSAMDVHGRCLGRDRVDGASEVAV